MLRGLWRLTWLEIKIFVREPLGVFGTVGVPVLIFVLLGRLIGPQMRSGAPNLPRVVSIDLPILTSMLIAANAVLSLVATPLRPHTILTAHVLAKLLFTALTVALMVAGGRRYFPVDPGVPLVSFTFAVLFSTISILSLGFVIASIVPTARFAQPIGALILYPMFGLSGLFVPLDALPPALHSAARLLPLTYAVSLLRGIWRGEGWASHAGDVAVLTLMFLICLVVSAKVFRWE